MSIFHKNTRFAKIHIILLIISLFFFIFILSLIDQSLTKGNNKVSLQASSSKRALRGDIISSDGYVLATSRKFYKIQVNAQNIPQTIKINQKNKSVNKPVKNRDFFANLYSIYTNTSKEEVLEKLNSTNSNVVLSRDINDKVALDLEKLSRDLYVRGVFHFATKEVKGKSISFLHRMDVDESSDYRVYPSDDILSPILGYTSNNSDKNFIIRVGKKGLEEYYNGDLNKKINGYKKGKRDIANTVILDGYSKRQNKINGDNLEVSINSRLQKGLESILDKQNEIFKSNEIIAAIMVPKSGEILAIATTNRANPNKIMQKQIAYLDPQATEYAFDPGSVVKPFVYAIALEHKVITPHEIFNTYNGIYKIKGVKKPIRDEHKEAFMSARNIIVESSNIGISQISMKLTSEQFLEGFKKFHFGLKTGIDLYHEQTGFLKEVRLLNFEAHRMPMSYGYGMSANFMQLLSAFNVFSNDGIYVAPKIGKYIINSKGDRLVLKSIAPQVLLSQKTNDEVVNTLVQTVEKGTGRSARLDGFQIGGKTGTGEIHRGKRILPFYNSSFFGFVNSMGKKYTIGVLYKKVPREGRKYFASQNATPTFKLIVQLLQSEGYIKKDDNISLKEDKK